MSRFLFLAVWAACAQAAEYWVATNGNDSASGSSAAPWLTIQKAVDAILPGDVITVRAGTYAGAVVSNPGTAAAPKTLRAERGSIVLLNALGPQNRRNSILEVESFNTPPSYWVIEGFHISGAPRSGIDVREATGVVLRWNHVFNSGRTGIFSAFAEHLLMEYNESHHNGEHGIYVSNSAQHPVARGNVLYSNAVAGIHLNGDLSGGGSGTIYAPIIEGNYIYSNGSQGAAGINCDGIEEGIIRNNLLWDTKAGGITLYAIDGAVGSRFNLVVNNTIIMAPTGRWVILLPASPDGVPHPVGNKIYNNILYTPHTFRGTIAMHTASAATAESDYNIVVGRFSFDEGDTPVDLSTWRSLTGNDQHSFIGTPEELFVSPLGAKYRLKPGSLAANAGRFLLEVTKDIRGDSRPRGGAHDIGAYETF